MGETIDQLFDLAFYELHGLELEHCSFVGTSMAKVSLYDCTLVGCDLSNALSKVAYYRKKQEDIPDTAVTYTDAKFIPFWVSLGFLTDASDGRLHISSDVFNCHYSKQNQ